MFQCLIDQVEAACKCSSALFPQNLNQTKQLKTCGFVKQSICASKYVKMFEYNLCSCPPECQKGSIRKLKC